ncbi:tyrosine kinase, putative [Entamoeba histolytica HM-1:IMSS-B]|uniref:Receptor protein kinase, putative n=6 Tax=Entamoeba histolytica TaxID=5759 RepID=C4M7N9_ENTH1|nr:receptor protein kinase, putative [Entamoeba histolytica HM-1:IMSS]EMD47763.1 tyrosine kinase, putative [Entamoeba histolytica KU27]EMH73273.1 tyrosine kinase, putative [Entamoeba histolytica HM-1:IMSS-B]EMS17158.1 tyrosine kinase, putative [Entamoeba histolytica HM-3:IMSS]ENY65182.1 tyrosine kinase, putative [Entamoeba histolytica HM-1:IMSS-A]GAT97554.1 receptor protein kinase putative [Entamoeba histolytica]|eukprot:XP_648987.1 receptor protein kinase, putative [Entamoeba histolytica HM-1:IMSS]
MFLLFTILFYSNAIDCSDGQYLDTSGECKNCNTSKHCKTCFAEDKCITCENNYYLDSSYQCTERKNISNCDTWDNLFCTMCKPGYYLQNQECKACTTNCKYCNSQECFQCEAGYTLVNNGANCVDCSKEENNSVCGRCGINEYFDVSKLNCLPCKTNCQRCSSAQNCFMCSNGFALKDPTDPLSECSSIEHCVSGHIFGDHCELCTTGFYLDNGRCSPCSEQCLRCINSTNCVECNSAMKLFEGKCVPSIDNCARSNGIQGCLECNEGFYLSEGSQCVSCPKNCSSCLNENYCFRCGPNYYFSGEEGQCILKNSNCKVTDQYGCLECYYDQINLELCKEYSEKKLIDPLKCSDTSSQQTFGYFLPVTKNSKTNVLEFKKECELCDVKCKICEYNSTWCSACNAGYALNISIEATSLYKELTGNTQNIYNCVEKPPECVRTEMGYCVECASGYFLSDVTCTKCDVSCGSCTSSTYCQTCNSATDNSSNALYWRPKSLTDAADEAKGKCFLVNISESNQYNLNQCASLITTSGCSICNTGYYTHDGYCLKCPDRCTECKEQVGDITGDGIICTGCNDTQYLTTEDNATCLSCDNIKHCHKCKGTGCEECESGYTYSRDRLECTKVNLALILPLCIGACLILIVIILIIIFLLWRRRRAAEKQRETEIRPFRVSSDVELALLSADNENFPLKTERWELDFGLPSTKAIVDTEYEQKLKIMNTSNKSYYFEILTNPSHRYSLEVNPVRQTLKAGFGIEVTFKIKMLCTAIVNEDIGIIAMDVDDNNKETAKLKIIIESDLSTKLDHTELKPVMPPIGEGAFGLVFRGTYRGQDVAIKKMKARNLTEEQTKEFNHEVGMLSQLRHQTIVSLIGAVYTEGEIAIVTEFAEFGSLSKMWGKREVSYDLKIKIMDDLAVALQFLHQNQIIHRDIKGENVLVYSLNPHSSVCGKLTDFGTCRNVSERSLANKELSTGIGTPTYMSPESLQGTSNYSYPVDIYAYGMVLYETFNEKQAYENDDRFNQPWMIPQFVIEGNRLERPDKMPDNYWNLITKCWDQEADKRPTATEILQEIASWNIDINYVTGESSKKEDLNTPQIITEPKPEVENEISKPLDENNSNSKESASSSSSASEKSSDVKKEDISKSESRSSASSDDD